MLFRYKSGQIILFLKVLPKVVFKPQEGKHLVEQLLVQLLAALFEAALALTELAYLMVDLVTLFFEILFKLLDGLSLSDFLLFQVA